MSAAPPWHESARIAPKPSAENETADDCGRQHRRSQRKSDSTPKSSSNPPVVRGLHLFAGIWGTLAVCIAGGGDLLVQIAGIAAIGAAVFGASWLTWSVIKWTIGVRTTPIVEQLGQDVAELGIEAYPEFVVVPDADD